MIESSISVIIPVYNSAQYLTEALLSIQAQSVAASEIILVDDGSTDDCAALIKNAFPAVKYYYQDNAGTGAARNRGVETATGNFLAFLDADDFWLENKLALQMAAFRDFPDTDAVFGQVKQFYSPELDETTRNKICCPDEIMPGYLPTTMLIKSDAFSRIGLFETNWQVGEGINWILRSRELGIKTIMLSELIYMRRIHKTNKGTTHRQFANERVRILKAHLDAERKRKNSYQTGR
jgi:glycosyltransferase involved in cell wall biosynthesis